MIDLDVVHIFALKDNSIFDLNHKVEVMKKALKWYASDYSYQSAPIEDGFGWDAPEVMDDKGKIARNVLKDFDLPQAIETTEILNEVKADKGILTEEELNKIQETHFESTFLKSRDNVVRLIASHRHLLSANAELSFKNMKYKQARFAFTEVFENFEKAYMETVVRTDSLNEFNTAFRKFMYAFMMKNPNETLEELK